MEAIKKLRVLSEWLINSTDDSCFEEDRINRAVAQGKTEVKQEIGELLREILDMDSSQIEIEIEK